MAATAHSGKVRVFGWIILVIGAVMLVAGIVVYIIVSKTLGDQQITVSSDASHFAGQHVTQPWQAWAEADTINKHAQEIAGGKTYAELPQDDPNRDTVMTASFLQASLFTSVVAFGVAVMAAGVGLVLILVGLALRWIASSDPVVAPEPAPAAPAAAAPVDAPGTGPATTPATTTTDPTPQS